jgi:hypothetical protein
VGLNLQAASRVILLDNDMSPTVGDQAAARAYRTGQERETFVYHLFVGGTAQDNNKLVINQTKQDRIRRIIDGDADDRQVSNNVVTAWFNHSVEVAQEDLEACRGMDRTVLGELISKVDCIRKVEVLPRPEAVEEDVPPTVGGSSVC